MIKINEEFKKLIPALSDDEFNQLEANCIKDGIRDAICLWNDTIIDGNSRDDIQRSLALFAEPSRIKLSLDNRHRKVRKYQRLFAEFFGVKENKSN